MNKHFILTSMFTAFILLSCHHCSTAQLINICENYCSKDFRFTTNEINQTPVRRSYAKNGTPTFYNDVRYVQDDCGLGNEVPLCEAMENSLIYDVFFPTNHDYSACKLPAIFLIHGGSYKECSDLTNSGIVEICKDFAKRGFVAFSIEYRRGILAEPQVGMGARTVPNGYPQDQDVFYTSAQQMLAIYRGCQDVRGAIRSIVKNENDGGGGEPWRIDVTKLFIGGQSAGSVIAINSSFLQDQATQWDAIFQNGISNAGKLGQIDRNDFYKAGAETPFPAEQILGIFNCWGTLMVPATYAYYLDPLSFFATNHIPAIITFQGRYDQTFSYNFQGIYFSPTGHPTYGSLFHSESNCLTNTYTLPGNNSTADIIGNGGQRIYEKLKAAGIFTEFYLDCDMEHGLDDDCGTCVFNSEFGTGFTNSIDVENYMVSRGATFFQKIVASNPVTGVMLTRHSKFVECQNDRHTCSTSNDDPGCDQNASCPVIQ